MHRKTRAVLVPGLHQNSRLHRSSQENRSLRSVLAQVLLLALFIVVRRTKRTTSLPNGTILNVGSERISLSIVRRFARQTWKLFITRRGRLSQWGLQWCSVTRAIIGAPSKWMQNLFKLMGNSLRYMRFPCVMKSFLCFLFDCGKWMYFFFSLKTWNVSDVNQSQWFYKWLWLCYRYNSIKNTQRQQVIMT